MMLLCTLKTLLMFISAVHMIILTTVQLTNVKYKLLSNCLNFFSLFAAQLFPFSFQQTNTEFITALSEGCVDCYINSLILLTIHTQRDKNAS